MMNLFQPSVKLIRKTRVGAQVRRQYDRPQTPLDRLLASKHGDPQQLRALQRLRSKIDPFALGAAIDRKLERIYRLANRRHSPRGASLEPSPVDARFQPRPRHWNHDWLFVRQGRPAALGAAVRK